MTQIFIKMEDGSKVMNLPLTMSLNELKLLVEEKGNYIPESYFLKFNGKGMYQNKPLQDYGVEKDSTIYVSIRATSFKSPSVL